MIRASGLAMAVVCLLLVAPRAWADAVPPPPDDCPAGTVGVTGHGGPHCEKEAPKNCPNGWRGQVGGNCILWLCSADADCGGDGKVCRQMSLCFEPHQRTSTCGANERARPGPELAAPGARVLGEPCAQLPEPVTDWYAVNVCGGQERCASPAECRPGGVCVSPTAPPPAPQPRNPTGAVEPKPGGCGSGCVGASGQGRSSAFFGVIAAIAWLAARRRRQR